jgi:hypothetical protein
MFSQSKFRGIKALIATYALIQLLNSASFAQRTWTKINFDIAGGGVITEIKPLNRYSQTDQLWVASMGGGCLRTTFNTGWGNWNQFCEYQNGNAIDVWEHNTGPNDVAILLAGKDGVWRSTNNGTSAFVRPTDYPNAWKFVPLHGVAFHIETDGSYSADHFYVVRILSGTADGIYQWTAAGFDRIDNTYIHGFFNITRDVGSTNAQKNTLYFTQDESGDDTKDGHLFRLTGTYGSATLTQITITGTTPTNIHEITSFYQDPNHRNTAYVVLNHHYTGGDQWELWLVDLDVTNNNCKLCELKDNALSDDLLNFVPESILIALKKRMIIKDDFKE